MSWSRFKFYCNEVPRLLERGESIASAVRLTRESEVSKEFGGDLKPDGIQSSIFNSLERDQVGIQEARHALEIYQDLDITCLSNEPARVRRVGVYIGFLTFMYFVLSGIYLVYVIPQSLTFMNEVDIPASGGLVWLASNWVFIMLIIFALLLGALLISMTIKDMFGYVHTTKRSWVYRFLLPKKIKAKYERLMSLIILPLFVARKQTDGLNDSFIQHCLSEQLSASEISKNVSVLIYEHTSGLIASAEEYVRSIYVVIAILVLFTIFQFIISAYTPLFMMGDSL